jgi:iron-sulfur cluster repair protein YtfE (RIC family)
MSDQEPTAFMKARDSVRRHALLRGQLRKATELAIGVVVEQRAPLCNVFLPLHRLFQEFTDELESYIELEEAALFPDVKAAGRSGSAIAGASGRMETVRLLKHGKDALLRFLDEMCELTQGFLAPADACSSYVQLLDVLRAIQRELIGAFCQEDETVVPWATAFGETRVN